MDSTSPLLARARVAVVQIPYSGFLEGLSTLTGAVGLALFMLLLAPGRLPVGVPAARRSGELLPGLDPMQGLFAKAWHGRMAAKPQVILQMCKTQQ